MAAGRLERIGCNTMASNSACSAAITEIPAPAADEVSKLLSQFYSSHGKRYQAHAARGANIHRDFVQSLKSAAGEYMISDEM
nr:PE family protein [Mycobacterium uberis]